MLKEVFSEFPAFVCGEQGLTFSKRDGLCIGFAQAGITPVSLIRSTDCTVESPPPGSSVLDPTFHMGDWDSKSKTNYASHAEGYFFRSFDGKLSMPVAIVPVNPEDPIGVAKKLWHRNNIIASLYAYGSIVVHVHVADQGASNVVSVVHVLHVTLALRVTHVW